MELVATCAKVLWILWASASLGCSFILKDCNEGGSIKLEAGLGDFRIRCRGVTQTDNITWWMAPEGEGSQPFVNCNRCYETYCPECLVDYPGYRVTRTMTVSTLTVPRNEKGIYGKTIRCGVGKHDWASCRVEGRGILEKFSVRLQGWRITGKADVRDALDRSNETYCIWSIVHGQRTTSMKTFIENSGDRLECRLDKSIQEIYTTNGMYDVSVELVPGYGPSNVGSVMISPPAPLQLEASTCPEFVAEGDDLRCRCHHQSGKRGSPRATVEWLDRQTEQDVLKIANVTRDMNGKIFTCRSSWLLNDAGIREQTYVLHVAYGPDEVSLTSSAVGEATQNVTLTCEAHSVNPSPLIQWTVPCTSRTTNGSVGTCIVSQAVLKRADQIQCKAMNLKTSKLVARTVYKTKDGVSEIPPGPLELEASTCPEFVAEGDDLRCRCRHQSGQSGSPRATVEWLDRQTEQDVLQIANVRRDMDGKVFTCRSSWLLSDTGNQNQTYELKVAYGPDEVSVTSSAVGEATQDVTLTCEAHNVNPSPLIQWTVPCTSRTTTESVSICIVSQAVLKRADQIQCQAINSKTTKLVEKTVYYTKDGVSERSPGSSTRSWNAYVIGGVVAALVAAGVVLFFIIVVLKRRKSRVAGRHGASDEQPWPTRSTEQISQAPDDDYLTPLPYNPEEREAVGFFVSADQPEAVQQMNVEDSEGYSVVLADMLQGGRVMMHLTRQRPSEPPRSTEQLGGRDADGYEAPRGRRV